MSDYPVPSEYPEVSRAALDVISDGVYRVMGQSKRGDYYEPQSDSWRRDIEQVLMARVDDGQLLPNGVEHAKIRSDGKRLIIAWMPAHE